jgi:hypothetical protein
LYLESHTGKLHKFHTVEGLKAVIEGVSNLHAMIIFTSADLSKVTDITAKYKVEKQAKVGSVSPIEVTLKAGPTGMDSSQIEMFQALKIQTKV